MYACGQFSRWVWAQCPTRTHAGTQTLSQPPYFKAVRSHSSSTWLSALTALGQRNQSSYFCTGFPGTVHFLASSSASAHPQNQMLPTSRMDLPLTCPTSSPSCHLTSDSQGSYLEKTRQRGKPALEAGRATDATLFTQSDEAQHAADTFIPSRTFHETDLY